MSSYNLESILEMADGDQDFINVLVQTFLEEIPSDVHALDEAVEANNATLAYQYVHKMKPNFQMFGLELMPQVKIIEEWAKTGRTIIEVKSATEIITNKVLAAEKELIIDFDL